MQNSGREMIDRYIAFSRGNRPHPYSKESEKAIRIGLGQFFEWWGSRPLEEFDRAALGEYKDYLWSYRYARGGSSKGYSIATVNQRLIFLRRFCEVCRDDWGIHVTAHPMAEAVEVQNIQASMLEVEHVKRLAKVAKKKDPQAYALILGLFYTGARISELMQMDAENASYPEATVKGKGRKYRSLFLPTRLGRAWKQYAKQGGYAGADPLFTLNNGERMTRGVAYWRLKRAGKWAGIDDRRVHPHAFRHLYARMLQEGGVPLAIIKQILGHRLDVTETYLQFSRERLFEIIEQVKL